MYDLILEIKDSQTTGRAKRAHTGVRRAWRKICNSPTCRSSASTRCSYCTFPPARCLPARHCCRRPSSQQTCAGTTSLALTTSCLDAKNSLASSQLRGLGVLASGAINTAAGLSRSPTGHTCCSLTANTCRFSTSVDSVYLKLQMLYFQCRLNSGGLALMMCGKRGHYSCPYASQPSKQVMRRVSAAPWLIFGVDVGCT